MLEFITNRQDIENELLDEIKLFFPYLENSNLTVNHTCEKIIDNDYITVFNRVEIDGKDYSYRDEIESGLCEREEKRLDKRACKFAVFKTLSEMTGITPPWGSLTGIRPSKLVYDMLNEGIALDDCPAELTKRFAVTERKSRLICDIVKNQRGIYVRDDSLFNLYIHIPFCTTKCNYCAFATELMSRSGGLADRYIIALRREIEEALSFISSHGKLFSVYVGGGTPTALEAEQLFALLNGFPFWDVEFTVEAGRPDTITDEKLDAIKRVGANRICVNPQTLNDKTLRLIGRLHTAEDFYDKFATARKYGFDINVDLIAGLNEENISDFIVSLDGTLELRPQNLTVHTLSRKNGSELKNGGAYYNAYVAQMTEYAAEKTKSAGYIPYYLYRQKQMLGNLENVGYCLPEKQCVNNITTMEDCLSVIACGAGAITKVVSNAGKRIARFAGIRDVKMYLGRFDEKTQEKRNFLEKQFTKSN